MAMEAPESSDDDDVTRTSLDKTFDLEVQEPSNMESFVPQCSRVSA